MKYLCMVYFDEKNLDALPRDRFDDLVSKSLAYDDMLRERGQFLAAQALQPVAAARTLRLSGGKAVVTDGPFAETREQLGGFLMIDARDMDEAIELASKMPPLSLGCIEVRPIRELREVTA